jgi:hypothetical protein
MKLKRRLNRLACLLISGVAAIALTVGPAAVSAQASTGVAMVAASATVNGVTGLYYDTQTDGSSTWNRELIISGEWSPPSITVQSNGNVLIASIYWNTDTLYFFWQGYGTTGWNLEQVSPTGAAWYYGGTKMAVQTIMSSGQAGYVGIVVESANDDSNGDPYISYYYSQIGKAGWYSQTLPGGYDGQTSPDIAVGPNNEFVVVFDPGVVASDVDGFFIDVLPYQSSSWSARHVGTGYTENQPQVEVQASGNIVIADTIGTQADFQGSEFYWSPANDIATWYAESLTPAIGSIAAQGVSMADNPASSSITVTGGFNGNCITATTQDYGPNPWTNAQVGCPGEDGANPEIAAQASGELTATSANVNGSAAYFYWASKGSSTWHTETIPGLTYVYESMAVTSYTP